MPRVYLKPIAFSANGYVGPAGDRVSAGFPSEVGYAPEEWNNHPQMQYENGLVSMRAFHAESLGKVKCHDAKDPVFLIMYASHDRIQTLVGIAAQATYIKSNEKIAALAKRLKINSFSETLWELQRVKAAFSGKRSHFDKSWAREHKLIPCCVCPTEYYFQPRERIELRAPDLTGKRQLLQMFSRYTAGSEDLARSIMLLVPEGQRDVQWNNSFSLLAVPDKGGDGLESLNSEDVDVSKALDIEEINADKTLNSSMREQLIRARIGQGKFRLDVGARWDRRCAVTGCEVWEVLRASHIQPWRLSSNTERLDPNNGLLLSATLDALFDRGLISFKDNGEMLVSKFVSTEAQRILGLPTPLLRSPDANEVKYLEKHRASQFRPG